MLRLTGCPCRAWLNWAALLQLLRLASTAACILLSADDGELPSSRASEVVRALAQRAHASRFVTDTRRRVFHSQLEDRSSTFRDALIHLTNCSNGRGKLKSMTALRRLRRGGPSPHCDAGSQEAPSLQGPAVRSLAGFLGVRVEDLDRAVVFNGPTLLPLPNARDELRGVGAGAGAGVHVGAGVLEGAVELEGCWCGCERACFCADPHHAVLLARLASWLYFGIAPPPFS
jgi:hypothetical protein